VWFQIVLVAGAVGLVGAALQRALRSRSNGLDAGTVSESWLADERGARRGRFDP
jgi:hypothetical protein